MDGIGPDGSCVTVSRSEIIKRDVAGTVSLVRQSRRQ